MGNAWQISAASLFEALRPAGFVLAALLSAWVLADARRRGLNVSTIALCALAVFLLPHVALPLYLAALILFPRPRQQPDATPDAGPRRARSVVGSVIGSVVVSRAAPAFYLFTLLALGGFYFYRDSRSADGLLARAGDAKLVGRRDDTIRALRAALAAKDDPHTRKLLGVELVVAGHFDEAVHELQTAERDGEPDDLISYYAASALDALDRPAEAVAAYRVFLQTDTCTQKLPAAQCLTADARLRAAQSQSVGRF